MASIWSRLSRAWRHRREAAAIARRPIPDGLWRRTLKRFPFLPRAGDPDEIALRRLCSLFLDRKEFSGAHGLAISDDMAVAIAAQACLPVLRLGLQAYDGFVGIVVHPGQARVRREHVDEVGIVHEYDDVLAGEAVHGGPVMLSWRDVEDAGDSAAWGYNVVVHEFAHVLDMRDGAADGVPLLPDRAARERWLAVLEPQWIDFCERVDAGQDTLIDPYGAEAIDEFFAVASELFFVDANAMRREHPALYDLLAGYYRQDPAASAG